MSDEDAGLAQESMLLRMQLALEASGMGTWSWDTASGRVEWDAATERVYGLEPGTFGGTYEAYLERLHPEDRAAAVDRIQESLGEGEAHRIQHRTVRPDGTVRWIEGWGRVLKDAEGNSVGLIGVSADVTDRIRSEIERAVNEERLARLQEVTSVLAETMSVSDVERVGIHQLMGATGGLAATIYLTNRDSATLELLGTTLSDDRMPAEWRSLPIDTSPLPAARAVRDRRVVRLPLEEAEGPTPRAARELVRPGSPAEAWAFPIVAASTPVGAVVLVFQTDPVEDVGREDFLLTIGRQVGQALARAQAYDAEQQAVARVRLLSEASEVLGSSLEYEETIMLVARAAVPGFADWCSVELLDADGNLRSLAVAHADPAKLEIARALRARFPPDPDAPSGIGAVIRTGEPELVPTLAPELIEAFVKANPELAEGIRSLQLESLMTVPLIARGRVLGAMSFVSGGSGRIFDEDDLRLAIDLARRAANAIDNARLFDDRNRVAQTLETSLRPPFLPAIAGIESGARYRPAGTGSEVAGDFYDVFEGDGDDWFAVVGDVSGKGAEAAAVMALARYTVRTAALGRSRPSEILQILNEALLRSASDRFCTATLLRMQPRPESLRLTVSSGGHPRPLILRGDGTVEDVDADGTLLGMFESPTLRDVELELAWGDTVIAYTDGVVEERDGDAFFGEERLREVLRGCTGITAGEAAGRIVRAVEEFSPGAPGDDIAVLALRAVPIAATDAPACFEGQRPAR
ncbi:MAG: SpoIIE family protein phosphatase [Actinomycetota bacterium]